MTGTMEVGIGSDLTVDQIKHTLENEHSDVLMTLARAKLSFVYSDADFDIHSLSVDEIEVDPEDPTQLSISYSYYWSYDLPSDREDGGAENNEFEVLEATYKDGVLEYEVPNHLKADEAMYGEESGD